MSVANFSSFCQQNSQIIIPPFNDKYSKYVKDLENGHTDIDFVDFRASFLDSKQYGKKDNRYDSLKKAVHTNTQNKNYQEVLTLTQAMLSIDYTSMFAHKFLRQTYKILGDSTNARKYHNIEFGLLHSIIDKGNGKSYETAWPVTQVEEEYFILNMLGINFRSQTLVDTNGYICDKMEGIDENNQTQVFYFDVKKVFAKYPKFK